MIGNKEILVEVDAKPKPLKDNNFGMKLSYNHLKG